MLSMASDAPTPHSPPIAMPNRARSTRKTVSEGASADANSITEYSSTHAINTGRRPMRSAHRPKRKAPSGRIASVRKIAYVTLLTSVPKSPAMRSSANTTRKKSNASNIQPRKAASTARRCSGVQDSLAIRPFVVVTR
jgi:hypothetical protein